MILLSTVATWIVSHAWRCSLMVHIVTDHTIECTVAVMMLIRIMMVILWAGCVVTMTIGWRKLLLRCEMRHWWLHLRQLLAIIWTGSTLRAIRESFSIRYETIWCRWWWRLATGCSTIVRDGWWFLCYLSSNVRLIWFYFTCTVEEENIIENEFA